MFMNVVLCVRVRVESCLCAVHLATISLN